MRASCFRRLFESGAGRIFRLAGRARRGFDVEDIHDLRVEVKRLRALLGVVKACSSRFRTRKPSRPFRRLFKAAAGLREAQVESGLVRSWAASSAHRLDEYRNVLKRDELKGRTAFAAEARRFRRGFAPGAGRAIDGAVEGRTGGELERLTEKRLAALSGRLLKLKRPRPAKGDLHRIRVQAKKTRYTLEILRECCRPKDPGLDRLDRALRAVHQALGRWHDLELASASLRGFLAHRLEGPLSDPGAYEAYGRFLDSEREKRLAEFEKAWARLVRSTASSGP